MPEPSWSLVLRKISSGVRRRTAARTSADVDIWVIEYPAAVRTLSRALADHSPGLAMSTEGGPSGCGWGVSVRVGILALDV
jgi:hypothetical protein